MHNDPTIFILVAIMFFLLAIGFLMQKLKQPPIIAYLIVGILLGPNVFGLISDQDTLSRTGQIGVVLLMFFVGMEVSPQKLASNWLIAGIGTVLQTTFTVLLMIIPSLLFQWSWGETILIGFVVSLSSTAVVIKLLQDWNEIDSHVGQNVLGILIVQDLLIVPMLIVLSMLKGDAINYYLLGAKVFFGSAIVLGGAWIVVKSKIHIPIIKKLARDYESQVFVSLLLCFGTALITSLLGLSSAFGAFIAGLLIATTKETAWVYNALLPLKTIFMAIFFVSIGMLVDLGYLWHYFFQTIFLVFIVLSANTVVSTFILKTLGENWHDSIYGASYLAQIGEFAFVLISIGFASSLIDATHYKILLTVIVLSLLLSPLWIVNCRKLALKYIKAS